jgi:subtilase family serine protease
MTQKTKDRHFIFARATAALAPGLALIAALLAPAAQAADQTVGKQVLTGHMQSAFTEAPLVGPLANATLYLAMGLPLRNQAALQTLLANLYDPKSPDFQHFLTPEQFTQQFGPSAQDYEALISFVRSQGLTVTATYDDHMVLAVSGSTDAVNKTFHISLTTRRRLDGSLFYAPEREPSVDLDTKILHVSGLDNLQPPKPAGSGGSGPGGSLGGSDFRNAYAKGASQTGAGQSVGLFELDGFYQSDIANYANQFPEFAGGVPKISIVTLDGFVANATQSGPPQGGCGATSPFAPNSPPAGTPGNGYTSNVDAEPTVDIEMAMAMAPGLANIVVYEGCNGDNILAAMLQKQNGVLPNQLSASWGIPTDATAVGLYQKMAAGGQSFLWAVGDGNTTCPTPICPGPNCGQNIRATMPDVTSVGGTILTMSGTGAAWSSETAATDGGGLLASFPIPSYQKGIPTSVSNPNSLQMAPDVAAMSGDGTKFGVWVYYTGYGGAGTFFGTSVAAPLWAGYVALANQRRAQNGFGPIGWLNPALYAISRDATKYVQDFYDIRKGTSPAAPKSQCVNGVTFSYSAGVGYDLVTGLGSPRAGLIADLGTWPSYPLYCQGPLTTSGTSTKFKWASQGAGATPTGPGPSQCAWADRAPRGSEIKQPGDFNIILGQLGQLANLPRHKYMAIAVYRAPARDPARDNDLVVTEVFGFKSPPFSSDPTQFP